MIQLRGNSHCIWFTH